MILFNGAYATYTSVLKRRRIKQAIASIEKDLYTYYWDNNPKRKTMKGRLCFVVARGKMNTIMIEFLDNGEQVTVSRYSIRKVKIS